MIEKAVYIKIFTIVSSPMSDQYCPIVLIVIQFMLLISAPKKQVYNFSVDSFLIIWKFLTSRKIITEKVIYH